MATASNKYAAATNAALCNFLSVTGSAASSYAAWGLFTPGPFDEWASLGYAGVAGLAYGAGCTWDSTATPTVPTYTTGCKEAETGSIDVWMTDTSVGTTKLISDVIDWDVANIQTSDGYIDFELTATYASGGTYGPNIVGSTRPAIGTSNFDGRLNAGSTCKGGFPTPVPPPYTWTDPDDGCQINVTFQGYASEEGGSTGAVWLIEPAATLRTGGGIIGGCNFSPVIYYQPPGGGGGGGTEFPYNPGPDGPGGEPWWMDILRAALGGVVGAAVKAVLDEILQGSVGGKVYRIASVCETDSQGEPISQSVEVDIPTLPWDEAIIYRLDALEHIMQGLKDFKQPICRPSKGQGDLVTVHFESDEPSIAGERPLRKTLNYRDQMASDLAAHAAHWENFAWEAGDVITYHEGAAWGKLTVWANSADEGKRVIRHAGTISGVNPDAEGEWAVTHSSSPRYGRTGTMRLAKRKSNQGMVLRISKRGTPDGLPIVPVDPAP